MKSNQTGRFPLTKGGNQSIAVFSKGRYPGFRAETEGRDLSELQARTATASSRRAHARSGLAGSRGTLESAEKVRWPRGIRRAGDAAFRIGRSHDDEARGNRHRKETCGACVAGCLARFRHCARCLLELEVGSSMRTGVTLQGRMLVTRSAEHHPRRRNALNGQGEQDEPDKEGKRRTSHAPYVNPTSGQSIRAGLTQWAF